MFEDRHRERSCTKPEPKWPSTATILMHCDIKPQSHPMQLRMYFLILIRCFTVAMLVALAAHTRCRHGPSYLIHHLLQHSDALAYP